MLERIGVLTPEELTSISSGLAEIGDAIASGEFEWSVALEDVHMNIEHALTNLIGDTGKKLHTGRSRNDQIATDIRLFLRDMIDEICTGLRHLQSGIITLAEREVDTVLPGSTHLQVAQPVSFGHHLMAWFEMIDRDYERMVDCRRRVNSMPLGAAALAGTSYPIDREFTAQLLGFESIAMNSLDAVSDRDFAIEFTAAASLIMMHLSRWAEEIILWSSPQFDYIDLPDRFCTGSSIMPQKKNPDVPELVRGKSGRVFGALTALLTLMKAQPLAYNKDNQEDKEPIFDTVRTVRLCLTAFGDMIPAMVPKRDNMRQAALRGHATATDLADYLVNRGLPFRDAHAVVGNLVAMAEEKGLELTELSVQELKQQSDLIDEDVREVLSLEGSMRSRSHAGGTAPDVVRAAIAAAREKLGPG